MQVKKIITYIILVTFSTTTWAQSKLKLEKNQYEISSKGDTINRTDQKGVRIGFWSIYHEGRYGNDPYYEMGEFSEGKKHGIWQEYTKNGLLLEQINYYNGYKNGEAKYYDQGQLVCIGNFKALRTDVAFDTLQIEDPITHEFKEKIIPTTLGSVRHGFWVYYKPPFNEIKRIEEWSVDDLIYEKDYVSKTDSIYIEKRINGYPHATGKEPAEFWSPQKGKAPARFTDFPENMQYIKPNVRIKKEE